MEAKTRALEKILLAVHHYPPHRVGGAELLAQRMGRWLVRRGFFVQVVCVENVTRGEKTTIHFRDEMDGDIRVRRLDLTLDAKTDLRLWFDAPEMRAQFDSLFDALRPDLLHLVSGYLLGLPSLKAAHARGIPTVVTLTDFWFLCPTIQFLRGDGTLCAGPEPPECARCLYDEKRVWSALDQRAPNLVRAFWQRAAKYPALGAPFALTARLEQIETRRARLMNALNQVDAIFSLTHFMADRYVANGIASAKILVKPDCLDLNDFESFTPRPFRKDEIHFGYLGQITPIKGVDVLLRAFKRVKNSTPKNLHLHLHGNLNADAEYALALKRLAGAAVNIHFHGAYAHRRALALLNELDVVVVPSRWFENTPRVIFEAFAARRPVIGTRVGGIAEIVHDNVNGLLFERDNVHDLARVMRRVVDEPNLLASLAQNIRSARTLDQDMQTVLTTYERVLANRTSQTKS